MNKRFVTLMIILCLVLGLFTGCLGNQSSSKYNEKSLDTTEEKTSASIVTANGELPIDTEPVTITIGLAPFQTVADHDDNYLTKRLEKDTGIDLNFYFFPVSNTTEKLELMVASREKLPDIILEIPIGAAGRYNYCTGGVIIPLNDYIEKYGYYFKKNSEKYMSKLELELLNSLNKSPDGNIYAFPFYVTDITDTQVEGLYINHEWLDAVNMDIPTTTDELYDVLVAFRDRDPNGNNLKDEIPLVGYNCLFTRGDIIYILMNSFRYYSAYRFDVNNGVVSPQFTDEYFREGLRYVNKLYKEGLLSSLTFTQDDSQLKAMIDLPSNQKTIAGIIATHPVSAKCGFSMQEGYDKVLEYTCLAPLKGPNGVSYSPYKATGYNLATYITRDCEYPEAAFRLLDYMCEKEISLTTRRGELGVDWVWSQPGAEGTLSAIGINAMFNTINNLGATPQKQHWHKSVGIQPPKLFNADVKKTYANKLEQANRTMFNEGFIKRYGKYPDSIMTDVIFTDEELTEINEIKTSIENYCNEARVLFVTGALDLDKDWDKYIKTLNDIGLEQYLKVLQTAYTRMNK